MGGIFSKKTWVRRLRSTRYTINRFQIKNVDKNGNVVPSVANCFGRSTTSCQRNLNQIAIEMLKEENIRLQTSHANQTREYNQATRNMMSVVNDSKTQFCLKTKEDGLRLAKDPTFIAFVVRVKQLKNTQQARLKVVQKTAARIANNNNTIGKFEEVENHYLAEDDDSIDMTEHMKLMMTVLNSPSVTSSSLASSDAERTNLRFELALDRANAGAFDIQSDETSGVSSDDMAAVIAMMFASSGSNANANADKRAESSAIVNDTGGGMYDLGQDSPDDDILLTVTGNRIPIRAGDSKQKGKVSAHMHQDDGFGV